MKEILLFSNEDANTPMGAVEFTTDTDLLKARLQRVLQGIYKDGRTVEYITDTRRHGCIITISEEFGEVHYDFTVTKLYEDE